MHDHHHHHDHDSKASNAGTHEKLARLLPHWIDHNLSHMDTYRQWSSAAREAGKVEVAAEMDLAVESLLEVNRALQNALNKLG